VLPAEVIGADHDVHNARAYPHDILIESHKHLRAGLPADAATHCAAYKQRRCQRHPAFGDRITDEYDARG